jgi:hypothetical protein
MLTLSYLEIKYYKTAAIKKYRHLLPEEKIIKSGRVGLVKLVAFFALIWIGILFIFLGMNAFMTLFIPSGSVKFYLGMVLLFAGLFLIVIGISYVVGQLTH